MAQSCFFLGDKPSGKVGGCFPGSSVAKNPLANAGDAGSVPGRRRGAPGGGNGNPLQYLCTCVCTHPTLLRPNHNSPRCPYLAPSGTAVAEGKERTKAFPLLTSCQTEPWPNTRTGVPGGGNGDPLQYSCLGNPMDTGAWWATVYGVTKNQIRLSEHTHAKLGGVYVPHKQTPPKVETEQ